MWKYIIDRLLPPLSSCYPDCSCTAFTGNAHELNLQPARKFLAIEEELAGKTAPRHAFKHAGSGTRQALLLRLNEARSEPLRRTGAMAWVSLSHLNSTGDQSPFGPHFRSGLFRPGESQAAAGEDVPLCEPEPEDDGPDGQRTGGRAAHRLAPSRRFVSSCKLREKTWSVSEAADHGQPSSILKKPRQRAGQQPNRKPLQLPDTTAHGRGATAGTPQALQSGSAGARPVARTYSFEERPQLHQRWQEWVALQEQADPDARQALRHRITALRSGIGVLDMFEGNRGYETSQDDARSLRKALRFWFAKLDLATGCDAPLISKWKWNATEKLSNADETAYSDCLDWLREEVSNKRLPPDSVRHAKQIAIALKRDMIHGINECLWKQARARRLLDKVQAIIDELDYWERLTEKAFLNRFPFEIQEEIFSGKTPAPDLATYQRFSSWDDYAKTLVNAPSCPQGAAGKRSGTVQHAPTWSDNGSEFSFNAKKYRTEKRA